MANTNDDTVGVPGLGNVPFTAAVIVVLALVVLFGAEFTFGSIKVGVGK